MIQTSKPEKLKNNGTTDRTATIQAQQQHQKHNIIDTAAWMIQHNRQSS